MLPIKENPLKSRLNCSLAFKIAAFTIFLCIGVIPTAHAYLDPGTFSFVIQSIIAAIVGFLFVLKSYWISIKNWFAGKDTGVASSAESVGKSCVKDKDDEDTQKDS